MSSIIQDGDTFHGISVFGRGVLTHANEDGIVTYAGQHKDGYACGFGVLTWSNGAEQHAEHGPDGEYDGRWLYRIADGDTFYSRFERGALKHIAAVFADGVCEYDYVCFARDDPRFLALIAQVAPVEVRPAVPATHPPLARHSPPSNRPMFRLGLLQALSKTMATEVHPHATRHPWWPRGTCQRHPPRQHDHKMARR